MISIAILKLIFDNMIGKRNLKFFCVYVSPEMWDEISLSGCCVAFYIDIIKCRETYFHCNTLMALAKLEIE